MSTKDEPGPLDGLVTAKPGEPIFTLQGGDPLAAPLVREWARQARERAHSGEVTEAKATALKIRATEAEAISWDMDAYLKGETPVEAEPARYNEAAPDAVTLAAIDEHKARTAAARKLDNAVAESNDQIEALKLLGYDDAARLVDHAVKLLGDAARNVRPHRT